MKRFKLKSSQSKFWFWVYIYKTQKELQEAANQFSRQGGQEEEPQAMLGIVHNYKRYWIEEGKPDTLHENIGIIRLTEEDMATEVVAHEIIHAAFGNYRAEHKTKANFGTETSDKEEDFAYLYGKLFRAMTRKLYKHKYWR